MEQSTWEANRFSASQEFPPILWNSQVHYLDPCNIFYHGETAPVGQGLPITEDSSSHSIRHATLGRTPLDE
jgi:hypothetical protein